MSVSAVSSVSGNYSTQAAQRSTEAAAVQTGSKEQDGDSDDAGVKAAQATQPPTVNLNGQKIGQIINVAA